MQRPSSTRRIVIDEDSFVTKGGVLFRYGSHGAFETPKKCPTEALTAALMITQESQHGLGEPKERRASRSVQDEVLRTVE